jgi:DNA-directed RNA polymerase subunit RPC12/RpoP
MTEYNKFGDPRRPEEWMTLECGGCAKTVLTRDMTLTGEGVRCAGCMQKIDNSFQVYKARVANAMNGTTQTAEPEVISVDVDKAFCARHPNTETVLKCAKCVTPICPKCMVHTPVGIRCPDCAFALKSVVEQQERQQQNYQRATGFRTQTKPPRPVYAVKAGDYLLALVAAVVAAGLGGIVWGFLLDADRALRSGVATAYARSIHLFPEFILGILVGSAVAFAVRDKRSGGLQLMAILGVLLGVVFAIMTLTARVVAVRSGLDLGLVWTETGRALGQLFNSRGGEGFLMLLLAGVGMFMAWLRLKR